MAHIEQKLFCKGIADKFLGYFHNVSVLDVGSLDVNGNNKEFFTDSHYIGIDVGEGPNVDIVSKGHEFTYEHQFDTIISTECFEHDMFWKETLNNIVVNLLRPGGLFLFTCATTGREEHGTSRVNPGCSPLTIVDEEWKDYYKNLTENDIKEALDMNLFGLYQFSVNESSKDLYFWGIKR
jgi:hypothetical protein